MTTHQDTVYAPSLDIGDGTNRLVVSSTGHLSLEGDATVWDDLRFPAIAVKLGGVNDPNFVQFKDDGSGSTGVYTYAFDKAAEEEIFFAVQFPHSWREGSTVYPHVHWCPVSTGGGNVVWGLEYTWASINGTFGDTTIITVTAAAGTTAYKHLMSDFDGITATGKTHSSMMMCRAFRKAADAADTLDADAALLEVDFHYEINQIGDDAQPGA